MVMCSKCGRDNPTEAIVCMYCGTRFIGQTTAQTSSDVPPSAKDFPSVMEDFGKSFGATMDQFGKGVSSHARKMGPDFLGWWDRSLGILSPIVAGAVALAVFLFLVLVADIAASNSSEPAFWQALSDFAKDNLWLFVALIFAGAFSDYLLRKYRRPFMWVRPIVTAVLVVGWVWAFAQVAKMMSDHLGAELMGDIGRLLEGLLWLVFIFALLAGYLFAWAWLMGSVVRQQEEDMLRYKKQ